MWSPSREISGGEDPVERKKYRHAKYPSRETMSYTTNTNVEKKTESINDITQLLAELKEDIED